MHQRVCEWDRHRYDGGGPVLSGTEFFRIVGVLMLGAGRGSEKSGMSLISALIPKDEVPVKEPTVPTHVEDLLRLASIAGHGDPGQVVSRVEMDVAASEPAVPGLEFAVAA